MQFFPFCGIKKSKSRKIKKNKWISQHDKNMLEHYLKKNKKKNKATFKQF